MIYSADDINLDHFNPIPAEYGPRDLKAKAVLVTDDNIGKIAIEFFLDVQYSLDEPMVHFTAERTDDEPIKLMIKPGMWIVLLWGEIHVFRDELFRKTFEIPKIELPEWPKKVERKVGVMTPLMRSQVIENARANGSWDSVYPETMEFLATEHPSLFTEDEKKVLSEKGVVFGEQAYPSADLTQITPAVGEINTPREMFGDDVIERSKLYEGDGPNVHKPPAGNDRPQSL